MPLKHADVALLEWFFGPGQHVLGGSSTCGAILERAWLYATGGVEAEPEIDVQPSLTRRPEPRWDPDDVALHRFGRMSRHLAKVAARDPIAVRVLEAVHGDAGAVWSRTPEGSLGAAYVFTAAGRELLKLSKRQTPMLKLSAQQRLTNTTIDKSTRTKMLIARARAEAQELYERACEAYYLEEMPCAAE